MIDIAEILKRYRQALDGPAWEVDNVHAHLLKGACEVIEHLNALYLANELRLCNLSMVETECNELEAELAAVRGALPSKDDLDQLGMAVDYLERGDDEDEDGILANLRAIVVKLRNLSREG